ncbi:MAG TPA: sugar ABC transporter permease [Chloroflexi bacterium]|nr:sugar ABC transporter permease [Chloroflexota bacterium]
MGKLSRDRIIAVAMVAPSILAIIVFVYGFIAWTGYVSLSNWDGLRPNLTFAGLRNFERLFQHVRFQADVRNTVVFTVLFLGSSLVIGFLLAILLDQKVKGENIFRAIYLFPMAVSFIVTGVAWRWLLAPNAGVNLLFQRLGLDFLVSKWYTDPTVLHIQPDSPLGQTLAQLGLGFLASPNFGIPVALISLVIAATWQMSGFVMALYLAGLRGIPSELKEAARVDGANEFQVTRHIILPLLRPVTLSAVIILGHISLKIFDLVAAMTRSGPGFATDVPALFMFETTFRGDHFAQGAAIAVIMLLSISVLIIPYLRYSMREEAEL